MDAIRTAALAAFVAISSLSVPALGNELDRRVSVEQIGSGNRANINSRSNTGDARILQDGTGQSLTLDQSGNGGNEAEITSYGISNLVEVSQDAEGGGSNALFVLQNGSDNQAYLAQSAAYGDPNQMNLIQNGNLNEARLDQHGSGNTLALEQQGDANQADLAQIGDGLSLGVAQYGGAALTITQTGP